MTRVVITPINDDNVKDDGVKGKRTMFSKNRRLAFFFIASAMLSLYVLPTSAEDLEAIRKHVWRTLPQHALERAIASPPLALRGSSNRGPTIYRERVNGVVLIASTDAVGTGVVISAQGDIITNEHVVEKAHKAQGGEWVAVWFKPPRGARPDKDKFLLAKVLNKNPRHDLALIRLVQPLPQNATVIPLATAIPDVGQEVFTIGHPKTYFWSFTQGVVSQIRSDYQWTYEDRIPRSATAIQTQAPINPGNSGGPLLNEEGSVVGIVVGSGIETQGIYFAVAVQHVHELLTR